MRTKPDVEVIIGHAKLNPQDLHSHTQTLYFSDDKNASTTYKLLELNSNMLETLETHGALVFKGGLNEKIVLCSDSKTYEVKEAEISNSLLVLPELQFFDQVKSTSPNKYRSQTESVLDRTLDKCELLRIFHEYYECREIRPRYHKLNELLQVTKFSGPENEHLINRKLLFTYDQLLKTTQCSRVEFNAGLKMYRAFEYEGFIRVADCEYEYRIVSVMLEIINEHSWNVNEIDREVTINSFEGIAPKEIVESLFDIYTKPNEDASSSRKVSYNEAMICRIVAQNILQQGLKFHLNEFMTSWQDAVGEMYIVKVGDSIILLPDFFC